MKRKLRVLVSGMVAGDPWQGGATWAVLQYVLGLKRLGHDVLLVEPIAREQVKPAGVALGASENVAYFISLLKDFGLGSHAALLVSGTHETIGLSYDKVRARARASDLLINIRVCSRSRSLRVPFRFVFTSIWTPRSISSGIRSLV